MGLYGMTPGATSLSASTARTVAQLRGATTVRGKVVAWGVSFNGTDSSATPVTVQLMRQTTDGTSFTAGTEAPLDTVDPAAAITSHYSSGSTEPTSGDVLESYYIHPQGGLLIREYPFGREIIIDDATSSRIGIVCNAPATVSVLPWIQWEE